MKLISARLESIDKVLLLFDSNVDALTKPMVSFVPPVVVRGMDKLENMVVVHCAPIDPAVNHAVVIRGDGIMMLSLGKVLDGFVSEKPLGAVQRGVCWEFRVFAPRASMVELHLFSELGDDAGDAYEMEKDNDGVWEMAVDHDVSGWYYCYRVSGPAGEDEGFDDDVLIPDPYGRIITARNTYRQEARTVVVGRDDFDWEDDAPVHLDTRDAVIYELHVKDMTAHASSGVPAPLAGSYLGLVSRTGTGGLNHIKRLGVNAVELLPCHHFADLEPPYDEKTEEGYYNTWNPYSRNHWGYMTSWFFAPHPSYAAGGHGYPGDWNDVSNRHALEFKEMVRSFHKEGIAVIMDVVFNHTSHYNIQSLSFLDRKYYYRRDEHGCETNASGCGNDFATERPMARRLIIDSVLHWMEEYHVDGFRFDLAAMIDEAAVTELCKRARALRPGVILIAEPWGGGRYDIGRFSAHGMSAWNDIYRNSVKGIDPTGGQGFIFGTWGWMSPEAFGMWVLGSIQAKGGPFADAGHSVNYLESHDGYTLGDFIRIASGEVGEHQTVRSMQRNARLTPREDALNKLAAMMLMTCQGAVMIGEGQEYARSKVIAKSHTAHAPHGLLDHNSYNKDDETNWLDYRHAEINSHLVDYYAGLISIRSAYRQLRHAKPGRYVFHSTQTPVASGFTITPQDGEHEIAVLINPNASHEAVYKIGEGKWTVLADGDNASPGGAGTIKGPDVIVPAASGMILVRG
jgi:pullulanase/glycogen debranching enzyme